MQKTFTYNFLKKHGEAIRGLSGVAALVALFWGILYEPIMNKYFPPPEILTVHSYSLSDGYQKGFVISKALVTKTRDDCNFSIYYEFVDSNGITWPIETPQTKIPVAERYRWNTKFLVPNGTVIGPARFHAIITFSHVSDESCNRSYSLEEKIITIRGPIDQYGNKVHP